MVYENCKIYGLYTSKKDGRKRIVVQFSNGIKRTVSYPKYIIEVHFNRYLDKNETVHHIDGIFGNNSLDNLVVIERSQHAFNEALKLIPKKFECPICHKHFYLEGTKLSWAIASRRKNKAGPFCGKSCAGKYGKRIQNGENILPVILIKPEYHKRFV